MLRIAVLDDYQGVSTRLVDWSRLEKHCAITVFNRHLGSVEEAASALQPFDVICLMRERMAFPRALIERLPNLKMLAVTAIVNRTLDVAAATERGIVVSHTGMGPEGQYGTAELTWGLILSLARNIALEAHRMRSGGWQTTVGVTLEGKTLGILGLGRIGARVCHYARAFDMKVIAWSQNMTADAAAAVGAIRVEKDELMRASDILSLHVVLSERTRGLLGKRDLALMKPTAYLVNTARAALVQEAALMDALRNRRIAGAALDVFHGEPLPDAHELRGMDNVVLTPHLGYTIEERLRLFHGKTVESIEAFVGGAPVRVVNPEVLDKRA